jgi:two-component sensor histidine kinase
MHRCFFWLLSFLFFSGDALPVLATGSVPESDSLKVETLLDSCKKYYDIAPEKAILYAKEGLIVAKNVPNEVSEARANYFLGIAFDYAGQGDSCVHHLKIARDQFAKLNKREFEGNSINSIGVSYYYQGDFGRALEYYIEAAEHFEKYELNGRLAAVLNNIAIIYRNTKRYEDAIRIYKKSIKVKESLSDSLGLATSYYNLGKAFMYVDKPDSSILSLEKSLEFNRDRADSLAIAEIQHAMGEVLYNSGRYAEAEEQLSKSWQYYQHHEELPAEDILCAYYALTLYALDKKAEALEFVDKGFSSLSKNPTLQTQLQLHQLKAELLSEKGDFERAFYHQEQSALLSDSLRNDQQQELLEEMKARFEAKESENTIKLQKVEIEKKEKEKNYLILVVGLIILLLVVVIAALLQWIKRSKELAEKNKIISENLSEKEVLLKEIHHRVKNNLQVVSSLLSIQSREISDEKALAAVNESRDRVKSMAIIHQNLYREENLTGVEAADYVERLCKSLFQSYRVDHDQINLTIEADEVVLDVDLSIPLGLVMNELISNALKHAFPDGRSGELKISLKQHENDLILRVEDNGVGLKPKKEHKESFGTKMINAFARKLNAEWSLLEDEGTIATFRVKNFKKFS